MNISLTRELEHYVMQKVASGLYQTASEVVRESLRLLRHQEKLEALRNEIAVGIAEADASKTAPLNARETLARVRKERATRSARRR